MSGSSLGLGMRPASNSSLPQQLFTFPRKSAKMLKEKERMLRLIFKFACRKKVRMLFIFVVPAVLFLWVLYSGKGEDPSERPSNIKIGSLELGSAHTAQTSRYFTGYTLPPGNPCEKFVLPPPPADKKRTGPRPCPVCYLDQEQAMALMPKAPSYSPVHKLTYVYEPNPKKTEFGGSEFGGYPSLKERADSFDIREEMQVHCGFVKGKRPGKNTQYDIDDADLDDMDRCRGIVVASAIFGNYDLILQPSNISDASKKTVCFFMFLDEETESSMRKAGHLDGSKKAGIWRIVIVHNVPFVDARRTGKVPKLLLHRLFPNARYSIWMDGKLELVVDPYQILERFLWRQNATFAISRHYKRFDVFVEAEANKAAGKYDNSSIDFQILFYKNEGLQPYSLDKLPITSDIPEGCLIIREHIPISNLFGCLWFNEVDRFTSRDQISFSTVRDKIRQKTNWTVHMFLDCERRNFVVQAYHKDVLAKKKAAATKGGLAPPLPKQRPPPPPRKKCAPPPPRKKRPPPPPDDETDALPDEDDPPRRKKGKKGSLYWDSSKQEWAYAQSTSQEETDPNDDEY